MNIIICGAGQVGRSIAEQLAGEGNVITVIDKNADLIREINDTLDVKAITGMASYPSVLQQAGADNCDMLIAVTYSDEVNMITCQIARSLFNIPTKVARIRQPDYLAPAWSDLYRLDHLPIDIIISPEMEVASAIMRRLHVPGALDSVPFANGEVQMLAIRCEANCPLSNLPFKIICERIIPHNIALLGVVKENRFRIPKPTTILRDDDVVYLLAERKHLDKTLALFGHHEQEARRLIILGGGNIGLSVAQTIEHEDHHVKAKLIELTYDRARHIVEGLEDTTVIHGSGLDKEILGECDIEMTETLVAVTNDDKVNILASLLAKKLGCKRTVTLVNNPAYIPMLQNLGIDVLVNPRQTTVSSILRHIRRGRINGVYSLLEGAAEIIEAQVHKESELLGKVVGSLDLPKDVSLSAILRNHVLILPKDTDVLHENDSVIMVSMAESIKQVESYFSTASEHF